MPADAELLGLQTRRDVEELRHSNGHADPPARDCALKSWLHDGVSAAHGVKALRRGGVGRRSLRATAADERRSMSELDRRARRRRPATRGASRSSSGCRGAAANLDVVGAAEAEGLRFVLTHTEGAAVLMAGAAAELTGRAGRLRRHPRSGRGQRGERRRPRAARPPAHPARHRLRAGRRAATASPTSASTTPALFGPVDQGLVASSARRRPRPTCGRRSR